MLLYACSELLPSQKGQYSYPTTIIQLSALAKSLTFLTNAKLRRPSLFPLSDPPAAKLLLGKTGELLREGQSTRAENRRHFPKNRFYIPASRNCQTFCSILHHTTLLCRADQKSRGGIWNLLFEFKIQIDIFQYYNTSKECPKSKIWNNSKIMHI